MFQSLWSLQSETEKIKVFEPLHDDRKTDVLVIGGGLCGVLCAYFLQQEGVPYMLVEQGRIGQGITKNTTAKITSQHGLIYDNLIHSVGREKAFMYLMSNQRAVERYRSLSEEIDCDFEEKKAGVYSCNNRQIIEREVQAINSLGFPAEFAEGLPLPMDISGAVLFSNQAQFHPLKFLTEMTAKLNPLNLYEHTCVSKIDGHIAYTENGAITADKIIVATHFPFLNKRGSYFLKLYQQRSYVLALENAIDVDGMYIDAEEGGFSFRNYDKLLLLGGGGHRTGKKGGNWKVLQNFAETAFPKAMEVCRWATQDCMSLDGIPYIGYYSMNTPHLYVASGFNKWGMTSSMVAAMLLCDLVLGRENPWSAVFSPSRNMIKPQLFVNGLEAVKNLFMPSVPRCPHMGCVLQWNEQEHTWDCPCHGSRFEQNGTLIDNPAKHDAKNVSS
ncbi:MAG: FAD-dependent oxidoreductase [Lachnospiraceae bacterium]